MRKLAITCFLLAPALSPAQSQLSVVPAGSDLSGYVKITDLTTVAPVTSVNGSTGAIISTRMLFTSGTTTSVSTTSENTIIGAALGSSSLTIVCAVGKTYRLRTYGQFTTPAVIGSSVTARVKINGVTVGTTTVSNLLVGATNANWSGDVLIAFRTCGVSGTALIGGGVQYDTGVMVPGVASLYAGTVTLDTTGTMTVDATAAWGASSGRSIGTYLVSLEALN